MQTYNTTESVIGTWLGTKTLYQKFINFGTLPNSTTKKVEHGISNLSRIIYMNGYAWRGSDGLMQPIPAVSTNAGYQISCSCDYTYINISTSVDRSIFTECYILLKYTKTTG